MQAASALPSAPALTGSNRTTASRKGSSYHLHDLCSILQVSVLLLRHALRLRKLLQGAFQPGLCILVCLHHLRAAKISAQRQASPRCRLWFSPEPSLRALICQGWHKVLQTLLNPILSFLADPHNVGLIGSGLKACSQSIHSLCEPGAQLLAVISYYTQR